ncbi:MAG: Rpp14/Pop5 family protein [Methanosarcinales archaeon Met12]|nr:MAG: Rpp14/Pop5 family protein [Methanosarcinales archaeon Met12]
MKILPSSLRERKRYLAFEVTSTGEVNRRELIDELWAAARSLIGDVGTSQCDLWLLDFDGRFGILRCARDKTATARAVLAIIDRVGKIRVGIAVLGTSGTIKSATEKFIQRGSIPKDTVKIDRVQIMGGISGTIKRIHGNEIDLIPDDDNIVKRSNVNLVGVTVFDLEELVKQRANDIPDGI